MPKNPIPKWNKIDKEVFRGSDHPLDTKDDVFEWFHKRIDRFLQPRYMRHLDRCELSELEVLLSMLYRLSAYFDNVVTMREDVEIWRDKTLKFFDAESQSQGDFDDEGIVAWRDNIRQNFNRFAKTLHSKEEFE